MLTGDPLSVAQQNAYISADLNSTLVFQFLFGIYTGLFPATLYIYTQKQHRTRSRDWIIIGNVTALFITTSLYVVFNWLYTNAVFLSTKGGTKLDMFTESATGNIPLGEQLVMAAAKFFVFAFADGLLVWRCFHAGGRSFRSCIVPIGLFTVETALVICTTVYRYFLDAKPNFKTIPHVQIYYHLDAATLVSVVATSLISTVVICLQIWRHTTPASQSRKQYRTIMNILFESSAAYSASVLFQAILAFVDTGKLEKSQLTIDVMTSYGAAVSQIVSGLAPTLMIAWLSISSSERFTGASSVHLPSDLIIRMSLVPTSSMAEVGADLEIQQDKGV